MNKNEKIIELVEKDFLTLSNLEGSLQYAIKSSRGMHYQLKVCHAAFKRTCDIMLKRRKEIAKMLGLKLQMIGEPSEKQFNLQKIEYLTNNPKHKRILRLLYELKLKPKQIINLKVKDYNLVKSVIPLEFIKDKTENDYLILNNRNKKYSVRTIQKIRENNLKKQQS